MKKLAELKPRQLWAISAFMSLALLFFIEPVDLVGGPIDLESYGQMLVITFLSVGFALSFVSKVLMLLAHETGLFPAFSVIVIVLTMLGGHFFLPGAFRGIEVNTFFLFWAFIDLGQFATTHEVSV